MGSSDIPPPSAPWWLIPASTVCLGTGVFGWILCYILMTKRALETHATPMPLLALGINLSWEVIYAFYVTEMPLELAGFVMWLLFDIPVVYVTLKNAKHSFSTAPLIARNAGLLLGITFVFGLAINYLFAWWWLVEPNRGHGLKTGKIWFGHQDRDTTELAWWSAGVAQMTLSVAALSMLLHRGHSGGQSYGIWACRFIGTAMGLPVTCTLLWWYWPEAHGFVFHPVSIIIMGTTFVCDLAYPFLLAHVRKTEVVLPNGMIVAGDAAGTDAAAEKKTQ